MATYTKKYTLDLTSTGNYIYEAIDKLEDNVDQLVTNLNSAHTTTRGDLIYKGASTVGRLAVGTSGQILMSDGTDPGWKSWTGLMLNGYTQRAQFKWKDGDEIYIEPGIYHHNGTTNQLVYWDSELTFKLQSAGSNSDSSDYGDDGWHYIYLDDSAIVTQGAPLLDADCFASYTGTNNKPAWTVAKHGWYGSGVDKAKTGDRCVFAVYETGGSILEFLHDGGDAVMFADYRSSYSGTPSDTFTDATLVAPGFCTKAIAYFKHGYDNAATALFWRTNGQSGSTGHEVNVADAEVSYMSNTTDVIMDDSQVIEVKTVAASTNTVVVTVDGWYFPCGM